MTRNNFGQIDQLGYLVANLDQSIARWIDQFGVGPWTVFRNVTLSGFYRGEPTTIAMDVALAYQGNIQVELIQVNSAAASPYRTDEGECILGLHHVAWVVDDLDAAVARATACGLEVVFSAGNPATQVAYLCSVGDSSVLYELICGAGMREMITSGIAAAQNWNGASPITLIDLAAVDGHD